MGTTLRVYSRSIVCSSSIMLFSSIVLFFLARFLAARLAFSAFFFALRCRNRLASFFCFFFALQGSRRETRDRQRPRFPALGRHSACACESISNAAALATLRVTPPSACPWRGAWS